MSTTGEASIDAALDLRMPTGATLRVTATRLVLKGDDETPTECRITFEMPPEVYGSLVVLGLFHLAPDNRGSGATEFAPRSTVRIEASLGPELFGELELLGNDAEAIAAEMRSKSDAGKWSPLLDTEAWYALHVTTRVEQDIDPEGELWVGYSTIFVDGIRGADDDGLLSLAIPPMAIATQVLDERGIEWAETSDDEVIEADIRGENGAWTCYIVTRDPAQRVSVYSQVGWYAPEPVRVALAELITRINYGLSSGNFEMDLSDGEIRYKTSVDVSGDRLSAALFNNLLDPNLAAVDTYLPALEAVRDGRLTPAEAVAAVEKQG